MRAPWPSYMNDVCKWLYAFFECQNNLELTVTKGHIAFNEPIPYWGLHGLAMWMMFVYDYMLFWISKTTLSWLIQKVILLSMNLSHIEDSMAYLYEWCLYMIICLFECQKQPWVDWYKRSYCFQWTYPILRASWPSYMNDVCLWIHDFWISKTTLSWLIQKVILLSMNLSHIEDSMA